MASLSITVLIPILDGRKTLFDDETIAGIGEGELIAIEDVVEKGSKVSTPAVPGTLFFGAGQKGNKGEGLF